MEKWSGRKTSRLTGRQRAEIIIDLSHFVRYQEASGAFDKGYMSACVKLKYICDFTVIWFSLLEFEDFFVTEM